MVQVLERREDIHATLKVASLGVLRRTQVCRAYKNKEEILQQWEAKNPNRKRKREGKVGDVEEALYRWFLNARAKNFPLSGPILKEKSKGLAEALGITYFNPTDGWLSRWKERNDIVFKRAHGEKKDADTQSAQNWTRDVLSTILEEFDPDNVYNWPNGTLCQKTEAVDGGKNAMGRLTVLLAANMTGTHKLQPLVIGTSKNPRCVRGKHVPLPYEANKKAWMTGERYRAWLKKTDREMGRKGKNIALLLDNCTAHPDVQLRNIRLVFLPANTTSILQPLDQGIILNL
ncbi:hypothetical protein Bbelb_334400 [Branchiostoma belcheri]|nr:hypothetical protein Bbelb_334400 [Branchiostoma belcheri]